MERSFLQEIYHRLVRPWNSAFFGYFVLIVVVFGGFGVAYSFFSAINSTDVDGTAVAQNLATYFMAILASSIIDLNISWEIENRVSFLIYSVLFFVIGVLFLIWTYSIHTNFAFFPAIIGTLLSWAIWILANAYNEKLSDENFYNNMRGRGNHGQNWNDQ
jgi:drug/metabolite transporter (DMT)-like permease